MTENDREKNEPESSQTNDLDKPLTPEERKELMERALASLRNPQPVPDDEKDDMFVNYR